MRCIDMIPSIPLTFSFIQQINHLMHIDHLVHKIISHNSVITTSFAQQDAFESTMIHEYRWMEWKVLSFPCSHFPAYSFIHSVRRISSSIYTSYDLSFNTYMNCHTSVNFLSLASYLFQPTFPLISHILSHTLYCCPVSLWKGAYLHFVPWIVRT